jgi:hypothetical protein
MIGGASMHAHLMMNRQTQYYTSAEINGIARDVPRTNGIKQTLHIGKYT